MKESDIRSADLFDRFLELVHQDNERLLADKSGFVNVACPGCGSWKHQPSFDKGGFSYVVCLECDSLYLSPRPDRVSLAAYCREAEAVRFWSTHFYKETAQSRKKYIFKPRAVRVSELAESCCVTDNHVLADVGAGYGMLLGEVAKLNQFKELIAIEPVAEMASICKSEGFRVIEKSAEQLTADDSQVSIVAAYEVLEHVFDPAAFLSGCARILLPGGLLQLSTLTVSGFDIQTLWERSKNIYAPHHINLLSVRGIQCLIERCGLDLVELTTPGRLDVDIVSNALQEDPTISLPPFFVRLVVECDEKIRESFQEFLAAHRLSSHLQCVVRRPFAFDCEAPNPASSTDRCM